MDADAGILVERGAAPRDCARDLVTRPTALDELRAHHPGVRLDYAWPVDLDAVARLLAAQVGRDG